MFSIEELIKKSSIKIDFQPIVSIKQQKIIGYEALARGLYNNKEIPPLELFSLAHKQKLILELDRLCRIKALETFKPIYDENKELLLFLNMDISVLDLSGVLGSDFLFNSATNIGIPPENIVIEFAEEKAKDTNALKTFVSNYKNYGFIIAFDNIGASDSSLERFFMLQPDIVKIDRKIINSIDSNTYKQDILKALSDLASKTGALVVGVGIENEKEALLSLELGSDMLQGFFFSEPSLPAYEKTMNKIKFITSSFKDYIIHKFKSKQAHEKIYEKILNTMTRILSNNLPEDFDEIINKYVMCYPAIECIYIINDNGIQVTETALNPNKTFSKKITLFSPATKGTNHEGKEFFYFIKNIGLNKYITQPYISLFSGNMCITVSQSFRDISGEKFYICIDILYSYNNYFEPYIYCEL